MTVATLIRKLQALSVKQIDIVMEVTTWSRGSNLPVKEQAGIDDVHDGLDCDGGFVYKITEA